MSQLKSTFLCSEKVLQVVQIWGRVGGEGSNLDKIQIQTNLKTLTPNTNTDT